MTRYLDTTFLVDLLRGVTPAVDKSLQFKESQETLATPSPCVAEIVRGIAHSSPRIRESAEHLLGQLDIRPLDGRAARLAGTVAAETSRRGEEVNLVDCLVAAIVLSDEGVLVTRDSDFSRVPGLHVETY